MPKNQLFRQNPSREVCMMVLESFGIKDFGESVSFSRKDLKALRCVEKMEELKPLLLSYYLPCKARTYLNNLDEKNVITILRQIMRLNGYNVISKEKYMKGVKYIVYSIKSIDRKHRDSISVTHSDDECVVTFS